MNRAVRRISRVALVFAIAFTAYACDNENVGPQTDHNIAASKLTGAQSITGELAGAYYGLYVPDNWNGDLVLFAHGFTPATVPLALPNANSLRDALLAEGFAFALSSWSENGMAIKDGAQRTAQLRTLFIAHFGKPDHVYLFGTSLGAATVMHLAETNPQNYDGVITNSGIINGLPYQLDNYFDLRAIFDYYYPGIVPGDANTPINFTPVQPLVVAAINANPAAAYEMANIDQIKFEYHTLGDVTNWIVYGLMFGTADWFTGDTQARTHHRPFFDNSTTVYTGSSDDDALNAGITRYTATPDTRNMLEQWYQPTGRMQIPLYIMQNQHDPIVPMRHGAEYLALATGMGYGDNVFLKALDLSAHGAPLSAQVAAVLALADWVNTGVRPTP